MNSVERTERPGSSFGGRRTWREISEKVVLDGREYSRKASCDYRYETGQTFAGDDISDQHFAISEPSNDPDPNSQVPHVLCGGCHGASFRIQFGSYSVCAICVACGKSAEVYSG